MPNCLAYSAFSRCQPSNFIASPPTMGPMGVPLRRRSRTSKQMCQPAAPHEMKRRSMLCHSVRRVPPPKASSSHRISPYSRTLGASARVTFVSSGVGVPTQVSFTVPTVPRFPSVTKGPHSRRCAGAVIDCQTFSGEWRSSRTRMSVHFSPPLCTRSFSIRAPLAGPGVYCSRSIIFFSLHQLDRGVRLPAHQLRDLNEIAAGVVQHGDLGGGHVLWWHGELGAARFHMLIIGLHVVGVEHGHGLALLEQGLLVGFGRRVVVERELQLRAVRLLG